MQSDPVCMDAVDVQTGYSISVCSMICPAYMTATRSAISAINPRSWVIRITDVFIWLLQIAHQIQDLGLNGDIQGSGGFIGDQKMRLQSQCHSDHHSLGLTAGHFMRVSMGFFLGIGYSNQLEEFDGFIPGFFFTDSHWWIWKTSAICDANCKDRVKAGLGLLENHRDAVAAHIDHFVFSKSAEGHALQNNISPSTILPGCIDQTQDREGSHAFSAAGFAHQPKHFAGVDCKINPITALTTPSSVKKKVFRFWTSNRGSVIVFVHRLFSVGFRMSCFRRGSIASRRPSPSRLKASTVIIMAMPGKKTRWGAVKTWLRSVPAWCPIPAWGVGHPNRGRRALQHPEWR